METFTLSEEDVEAGWEMMRESMGLSKEEFQKTLEESRKLWCKCGNPSGQTDYYADGEGELCHKHHYICKDCDLIWQVG